MAHTNSETDTYSWANSKINTWLNDTTDNGFVSQYGLDNVSIVAGNSEVGKVFILSYAEATTYNCTADVTYVGDTENEAGEYGWWLRDAGTEPNQAMQILMNTMQGIMGNTMDNGANNELGVRPAFWIDIK